jgi:hypothetical protein
MNRIQRRVHLWLWLATATAVVVVWVASRIGGVP